MVRIFVSEKKFLVNHHNSRVDVFRPTEASGVMKSKMLAFMVVFEDIASNKYVMPLIFVEVSQYNYLMYLGKRPDAVKY